MKMTLADPFIFKSYVLSTHSYIRLKKYIYNFFLITYISCQRFMSLKAVLIKTNKNYMMPFLGKVKS